MSLFFQNIHEQAGPATYNPRTQKMKASGISELIGQSFKSSQTNQAKAASLSQRSSRWSQEDNTEVKSTRSFCRGTMFSSLHQRDGSQQSITPLPGGPVPSFHLCRYQAPTQYKYIHMKPFVHTDGNKNLNICLKLMSKENNDSG